jgi:protein-tyrosine-phosphatase
MGILLIFQENRVTNKQFNVLFICTGNSARSIMAEALLTRWGHGNFIAFSAGSKPKGQVHPKTLETLEKNNFNIDGLRSKSWEEYTNADSPEIDFIISVCSNAANETCPIIPGEPLTAHWDIDDPAREYDSKEKQNSEFQRVFKEIELRIQSLTSLLDDNLDKSALHKRLQHLSDPT